MGNENKVLKVDEKNAANMNAGPKPKCPYYSDTMSELVCPYYMMSNMCGAMGIPYQNGKPNWAGMAGLIMGIISMSMCWLSLLLFPALIFIIISILAIIFSGIGLRNGGRPGTSKTSAWAGLILGILSLIFTITFLMLRLSWYRGYYY